MRVAVVGRGRLGSALALACHARGHEVDLAVRNYKVKPQLSSAHHLRQQLVSNFDWDAYDLVVLATPLPTGDSALSQGPFAWMQQMDPSVPIASAIWDPSASINTLLPTFQCVRFICTPAVAGEPSACWYDAEGGQPNAIERLKAVLNNAPWRGMSTAAFNATCSYILVAPLICAATHAVRIHMAEPTLDSRALMEAVGEAGALLRYFNGHAASAFNIASPIGGESEQLVRKLLGDDVVATLRAACV